MPNALNWQKSTYSGGGDGDNCVELAATTTAIHLRESDAPTTALTTGAPQLHALLTALKAGHAAPTGQAR
ncbi:DUF397 domain-containing protein [Streptomyces sp. NPDC050703]|uniref:DUF397 domain-containing protein n=1 Tax=Streptomyces sp. NPDC050703 TaxID=3157218 RepID=UPI00343B8266